MEVTELGEEHYEARMSGVTSLTVVKDEPFISHSLNSVKDLVDTLIIVDASQYSPCVDVADDLSKSYDVIYVPYAKQPNYAEQFKLGYSYVDSRWVLVWDGDFIALPQLQYLLQDYIYTLPRKRSFYIEYYCQTIGKVNNLHREAYLLTSSPNLCEHSWFRKLRREMRRVVFKKRFGTHGGRPDIPFPLSYKRIRVNDVFFLHIAWRYD